MFYGEVKRRMDEKGRISLPKKTIEYLGKKPVLQPRNSTILVFPERKVKELKPEKIYLAKIDRQGRLFLPAVVRQKMGIKGGDVFLIGKGDHFIIKPLHKVSISHLLT